MALLPTPRLLLLTLLAAVPLGAATIEPAAFQLAVLYLLVLLAVAATDLWRSPSSGAFAVERRCDERLSLGEDNPVDLVVRWVGPWRGATSSRLWVRDEAPPEIPVDRVVLAGTIPPGGEWVGRYHLKPLRRGEYAFGAVVVRVETSLGLLIRQQSHPLAAPARVYPSLRAVHRYDLLSRRGRLQEAGLRSARLRGSGTEFERLRDYLPDDDYRRIAWKATARRYRPVTVEYETERSQSLILALDAGRLMSTPVGSLEKLDYAVNAALMLAYVAIQRGDRVGLVAFADRVGMYVPPGRGRRQFHVILESLHKVRSQPVESDPGRAFAYLASRQARRALLVLFADVSEAAAAEGLVAHLRLLARRHLPLYVTIGDPDLARLAAGPPTDSRQAYEKVVAQRLLDERRATLERFEAAGALALDVPAEQLTAAVINRYVEIKARTQL